MAPEQLSWLTGAPDEIKSLSSYSFEVYFQKDISKRVSLKTKISLEDKGAERYYQPRTSPILYSYAPVATCNLNYLNIPILVRAHWGEKPSYFLEAGPYVGFLLNGKVNFIEVTGADLGTYDNTKYFKTVDAGMCVGAGISYPFHKFIASLEYMRSWGIVNILSSELLTYNSLNYYNPVYSGAEGFTQAHTQTQSISLSIGYKLEKRKVKNVTPSDSNGKQDNSKKIVLGIEGGVSSSYYYYYAKAKNYLSGVFQTINPLTGYSIGVTMQSDITPHFSFWPNISFSRTGFFYYTTTYGANSYREEKISEYFDYLNFTCLAQVATGEKIKYFLIAGPYLGFLIDHKQVSKYGTHQNSYTGNEGYSTSDLGLTCGLGLIYPLNGTHLLSLEIKNNYGFSNIYDYQYHGDDILKTRSVNLSLGFTFIIEKKKK